MPVKTIIDDNEFATEQSPTEPSVPQTERLPDSGNDGADDNEAFVRRVRQLWAEVVSEAEPGDEATTGEDDPGLGSNAEEARHD